jgi:hypothetical protein
MSEPKKTIEELRTSIEPLQAYVGRKIKHTKSVSWYRVTGIHFVEETLQVAFSYETMHRHPVSFIRPIAELLDGRFEIMRSS